MQGGLQANTLYAVVYDEPDARRWSARRAWNERTERRQNPARRAFDACPFFGFMVYYTLKKWRSAPFVKR